MSAADIMPAREGTALPTSPLPTPCVGVCRLDEATGLCLGCARTGDEIAKWREAGREEQRRIWQALPERRTLLNMSAFRLPWGADEVAGFIEESLRQRAGVWVLGVYGAVGEFLIGPDEDVEIVSSAETVTARTPRGALRLAKHPKTVAFAIGQKAGEAAPRAIGFALPAGRVNLPGDSGLRRLGPDLDAVSAEHQGQPLYDLGLGRKAARFCVRSADPQLIEALAIAEGMSWPDLLARTANEILRVSPARVIETGLGRVEIFTPIPSPGGISPDGPHTHLLSDLISLGRDTPPDWDLQPVFAPAAMFYPHSVPHRSPPCGQEPAASPAHCGQGTEVSGQF